MIRLKLILSTLLLLPSLVFPQASASALFLLISPGASAGGTGEAQVAATNDAYASYWNPAAMAYVRQNQIAYQYAKWLPNLVNDMAYNFISGTYYVPHVGTFGAHLIYLDLGMQIRTDETGNELENFTAYMAAIAGGFGTLLSPNSSIGLNFKIIHQALSTVGAGGEGGEGITTDFAFDMAYFRRNLMGGRLDYGLLIANIGPKIAFIDVDQADPSPTNLKFGIKLKLFESEFNRLALLYDVNHLLVAAHPPTDLDGDGIIGGYDKGGRLDPSGGEYSSEGKMETGHTDPWYLALVTSWYDDWLYGGDLDIDPTDGVINEAEKGNKNDGSLSRELASLTHNIGIEYWYSDYFAIRAGFIYEELGKIKNPTFGAGIHYGPYGFDFGFIYGEEGHPLTNTMRFSGSIAF